MDSSIAPATAASNADRRLHIPIFLWRRLVLDLRGRGHRKRESGAFVLGQRDGSEDRAASFVPYDELDPQAFATGIIRFSSEGYSRLWRVCRERQQRVVADVHTHPTTWVSQSDSDQRHPMIPEARHLAFILPSFAHTPWWTLDGVGMHEYQGGGKWNAAKAKRAKLTLW